MTPEPQSFIDRNGNHYRHFGYRTFFYGFDPIWRNWIAHERTPDGELIGPGPDAFNASHPSTLLVMIDRELLTNPR